MFHVQQHATTVGTALAKDTAAYLKHKTVRETYARTHGRGVFLDTPNHLLSGLSIEAPEPMSCRA